jgi:hypothetical protein
MEADTHEKFRNWITEQNIHVNDGIKAAPIIDKGIGVVAIKQLKVHGLI